MNEGGSSIDERTATESGTVLWNVYERDDRVHAVADVPSDIPREELGFGANDTEAAIFVGTPNELQWTVTLPSLVEPNPISVTYNNGVFEMVFARENPVGERSR